MTYIKTIIAWLSVCVVGVLILPSTLYAENEREATSKRRNSLVPGSLSIQFQIEDDIGLKSFSGNIISLKRHFSRKTAFRVGISLDLQSSDTDDVQNGVVADTITSTTEIQYERNSQVVQVNALYMNYPNPDANVNLFLGMGPLVRFSRSDIKTERSRTSSTTSNPVEDRTTNWARSWAVGAIGVAGVEWFATKGISFHAEYRAQIDYEKNRTTSERIIFNEPVSITNSEAKTSTWNFDGVGVTLGLSIYF